MDDESSRRRLLLSIGGAVTIGVGLGGCLGDDGGDDGDSHPEPDERPPGLDADGIDLDVLRSAVETVIQEEAFSYEGFGRQFIVGAERREVDALRLAADNDARIGFTVEGSRTGELTDPLHAPQVEMFYAEDDSAYEVSDFGTPEAVDGDFDTVIEIAMDHLAEVLEYVTDLDWGAPSWDTSAGQYAIPAVDIDEQQSAVTQAELHVDADGIPVGLTGRIDLAPGRTDVEITFTPGAAVERPEWIEDAV